MESKADLVGLRAAVDLQSDTSVFTYRADDRKAALNSLEIKSDFHFTKIFVYFSVLNQKMLKNYVQDNCNLRYSRCRSHLAGLDGHQRKEVKESRLQ